MPSSRMSSAWENSPPEGMVRSNKPCKIDWYALSARFDSLSPAGRGRVSGAFNVVLAFGIAFRITSVHRLGQSAGWHQALTPRAHSTDLIGSTRNDPTKTKAPAAINSSE